MFSDPQSLTIGGVATSLPRTGNDDDSATYTSADRNVAFTISHREVTKTDRLRHEVRVDFKKVGADPLTTENKEFTGSVYLVVDQPIVGFTTVELRQYVLALTGWATSANVDKVLGMES